MRTALTGLALLMAGTASAQVYFPADGIWQFPDANGSGLSLDFRDGTIGIGLYTYDDAGRSVWYSGAGRLVDGTLETGLLRFSSEAGTPVQVGDPLTLRMTFSSVTTASLSLGDAAPRPIRHALFGVDTIEGLAFHDDDGPVTAVPDMRGRWVFTRRDPSGQPQEAFDVVFGAGMRNETDAWFVSEPIATADTGTTDYRFHITCGSSPIPVGPPTSCTVYAENPPYIGPVPPQPVGDFGPGDLGTMHVASDAGFGSELVGFRVPAQANAPMSGIWQIQGRNGEGVSIDVRPDIVAVGVFGYDDDGAATWSLATGALEGNVLSADLSTFAGGACLACGDGTPQIETVRPMQLEFVAPTRALLSIGDDAPLALSLLPFGPEYLDLPIAADPGVDTFGPHRIPALLGSWVRTGVVGESDADAGYPTQPAVQFEVVDVQEESADGTGITLLQATSALHWGAVLGNPQEVTGLRCGDDTTRGSGASNPGAAPAGTADQPTSCVLQLTDQMPSPPSGPWPIADVAPWNITATRISAVGDVAADPVYIFRIPPNHTAAAD